MTILPFRIFIILTKLRFVKHAAAIIKSREIHIKSNSSSKQPSARYIMLSADIQLYYYLLSEVICMKPEIKPPNTRSAPRGAAVFIVDSCVLRSSILTAGMIVLSINLQSHRLHTHLGSSLHDVLLCYLLSD